MERVTEMVEHVVAPTMDHAGLDDGPGEPRIANRLFRRPLGPVVLARAVGSRAEEGHHDEAADPGGLGRADYRPGALDVDTLVRLTADFAIDAGAMDDRGASLECLGEGSSVGHLNPGPPPNDDHLVAIRPLDGALCIETMRHADEVIPIESIEEIPRGDDIAPNQKELDMARQLIEALSGDFEPEKYTDAYRNQLLEIIEKKAAGEEIVAEPLVEEPAKVVDLMAALEASLARAGKGESGDQAPARSKAAAKKTKKAGAKKATKATKTRSRSRKSA